MNKSTANRSRIVGIRLSPEEYTRIEQKWKATTCPKLSDYVRRKLFDKALVTTYRNKSLDDFMTEMMALRQELNSLAVNFNQSVKKLNALTRFPEEKNWLLKQQISTEILLNKVGEIKQKINSIADIWLQ